MPTNYEGTDMNIKKLIIAPDSFKGSMSSSEVADIIEQEALRVFPECEIKKLPIADGGEGSLDAIVFLTGGEKRSTTVISPDGSEIAAKYLITDDGRAILELAESSGFARQQGLHPMTSSTYGFGQLILDALNFGAKSFTLCIGGSATTDGGCGMAAALGVRFLDKGGKSFCPCGETLKDIAEIDLSKIDERIRECTFTVMCDVENPLFGENGAAYRYAPQKGANEEQTRVLDEGLRLLGGLLDKLLNKNVSHIVGGGAAGGLGAGCVAFLDAKLTSGIEAMLNLCDFNALVKDADAIITGEGKLDEQSLMGKVLSGIIKASNGLQIISICGVNKCDKEALLKSNIVAFETSEGITAQESLSRPTYYLQKASSRAVSYLKNK